MNIVAIWIQKQCIDGPGKLTQAMHITRALNAENFSQSEQLYFVDDGFEVAQDVIKTSPRIGVAYAGEDALLPWRYFIQNV